MSHCARGFRRRERPRGSLGGARLRARGAARAGAGRGRTHQLVVRRAQGHGALVVLVFEHESHLRGVAGVELLDLRRELVDARRALRHGAEDRAGTLGACARRRARRAARTLRPKAAASLTPASPRPRETSRGPRRCTGRGARGRCGRSDRGGRWRCVIRGAAAEFPLSAHGAQRLCCGLAPIEPRPPPLPRAGATPGPQEVVIGGRPALPMLRGAARPRPRVPPHARKLQL